MAATGSRGQWGSKLGFIMAAAGSAVGLGNIWKFPSEVAENGGGAFLIVYLILCFMVGYPVMVAELSIGRATNRNPFGAFRQLHSNPIWGIIGLWGILCGVMILSFYAVVAGWTFAFAFSELFIFLGNEETAAFFGALGNGPKNAIFSVLFMLVTIKVVSGGVSAGIERVTKVLMPLLIGILLVMIGYVLTLDGSGAGLKNYLTPNLEGITSSIIFESMGQAFFSLSLGMGALITYGSYLDKKENIPEVAAYVTLADVGIAFVAGLLIIPSMYVAQQNGIQIFDEGGALLSSTGLVFSVLPELFSTMGSTGNIIFGVTFFLLLSMAALTSTISLLEIGGFMICIFIAYVWQTKNALAEMENGFLGLNDHWYGKLWSFTIKFICPILILIILYNKIAG